MRETIERLRDLLEWHADWGDLAPGAEWMARVRSELLGPQEAPTL